MFDRLILSVAWLWRRRSLSEQLPGNATSDNDLEHENKTVANNVDAESDLTSDDVERRLEQALKEPDQGRLASVLRDVLRLYGGQAKEFVRMQFPEIQDLTGILEAALVRTARAVGESREEDMNIQKLFLTAVNEEVVASLLASAKEEYDQERAKLPEEFGSAAPGIAGNLNPGAAKRKS